MSKLESVDPTDLRDALEEATEAKAAKRLMVALDYLDGTSVDVLNERYGFPRSTIYYWLSRFEDRPIDEAIVDESRPGRPTELDRETVRTVIAADPRERDVDADEWTPALLRAHLEEAFDVSYSEGHVRRLLRELQ